MQVDMHYYGTYAMARAAGLKADVCKIIATAAEFVDDNAGLSSGMGSNSAGMTWSGVYNHPSCRRCCKAKQQEKH